MKRGRRYTKQKLSLIITDPVLKQKFCDHEPNYEEKWIKVVPNAKIVPSLNTRLELQDHDRRTFTKSITPRRPVPFKIKKASKREPSEPKLEECKIGTIDIMRVPSPMNVTALEESVIVPAVDFTKIFPKRASFADQFPKISKKELQTSTLKSGLYLNETQPHLKGFDAELSRILDDKERQHKRELKQKSKILEPEVPSVPIDEAETALQKLLDEAEGLCTGEGEESDGYLLRYRRKVSQISASTSIRPEDTLSRIEEPPVTVPKYVQKQPGDGTTLPVVPSEKIRHGTFASHSFTKIKQTTLKNFYYGIREGTIHFGDEQFPQTCQGRQGICIPIAAYCYTILKHPNEWNGTTIEEILQAGTNLYLESCRSEHIHGDIGNLHIKDLSKFCVIAGKKLKYTVSEPEITGTIRSQNKRIFNLTKGLNIFFETNLAGIFQTDHHNIVLWKDKHYYMFDGAPRTKDLYQDPNGTALLAHFYDIPSVITVLLERTDLGDLPFIIRRIEVHKIYNLNENPVDENEEEPTDGGTHWFVVDANRAVLNGSFDLSDNCFGFSRNKQALTISIIALIYSKISPPNSWQRQTIDKIMIIGNRFYMECAIERELVLLNLDDIPAIFTIGPYLVEITVVPNLYSDLLIKKGDVMLKSCLRMFFESGTCAILAVGTSTVALWRQRGVFYYFDPYTRDSQGLSSRNGTACVSMHTNLGSLIDLITKNFQDLNIIFTIHALKVCRINRDPAQKFPRNLTISEYPNEQLGSMKMRKTQRCATHKKITIDNTTLATSFGGTIEGSITEIGSNVLSLNQEQLPQMCEPNVWRAIFKTKFSANTEVIADLDSPSLSETQVPPLEPQQPTSDELSFLDLDAFDLTKEELELAERGEENDEIESGTKNLEPQMVPPPAEKFLAKNQAAQVRTSQLDMKLSKISANINTDLSVVPLPHEELPATNLKEQHEMSKLLALRSKTRLFMGTTLGTITEEPNVTLSEELSKASNFMEVPDGSQIIMGTKNMIECDDDLEFMAPFVCIMATVVAKKYALSTWTTELVDYVLKCGSMLYKTSKIRYDQVYKFEVPQVVLGQTTFNVLVDYIHDAYIKPDILEQTLMKNLFGYHDAGILVTPTYACALFQKNHLYYMYDGFANNDVGLGTGTKNLGKAFIARFRTLNHMVTRIIYNKKKRENDEQLEFNRFVLSSCTIKLLDDQEIEDELEQMGEGEEVPSVPPKTFQTTTDTNYDKPESEEPKEPKIKIGYQFCKGICTIQGTQSVPLSDKSPCFLSEDYFICICACLMLLNCTIDHWTNRMIDQVVLQGTTIYSLADDLDKTPKRVIKNLLIDKYFFDIIVQPLEPNGTTINFIKQLSNIFAKNTNYIMVQFTNTIYVVHRTINGTYHLFEPYSTHQKPNAGWIRIPNLIKLKSHIMPRNGHKTYNFLNFKVTNIRKAPKEILLKTRLENLEPKTMEPIQLDDHKPFNEQFDWLDVVVPIWSRLKLGKKIKNSWHHWTIELPNDLYSLFGNLHQTSTRFSPRSRGKQTIANLVIAIGMLEIYELAEWTSAIIDSILVNGDHYFQESCQNIMDDDYELAIYDLKDEASIFPYNFKIKFEPIVAGTMFLLRSKQFNLYKALRYFFDNYQSRYGIIFISNTEQYRQMAFGKIQDGEYFLFDCETIGSPIFQTNEGSAYALRTTRFNRLLYCLTIILRGGDFYIYDVKILTFNPVQ